MLIVSDEEQGTPESTWLTDPVLPAAPPLDATGTSRLVVVAPHPDDEVLGAAGLLRACARLDIPIEIVAVTDGEASHPGSSIDRSSLARWRRRESTEARRRLGIEAAALHHLELPDGHVDDHESDLATSLTAVLDGSTTCVTSWRHDGHPDHDATGRAAALAAERTGAQLLEYPIWAWHWCTAGSDLPTDRLRRLDLTAGDRDAKVDAIQAFGSQIHPLGREPGDRAVLPPTVRHRFERPFEIYLGERSR